MDNFTQGQIDSLEEYLNRDNRHEQATVAPFPKLKDGDFNWFQRLLRLDRNNDTINKVEVMGKWVKYTVYYREVERMMYVDRITTYHYD